MTDSAKDRKKEESDLALKCLNYAVQLFQNAVGRVWQRSLAFSGFVAAAFVAYGVFIDKHNLLALAIACFGLVLQRLLDSDQSCQQMESRFVGRESRLAGDGRIQNQGS